MTARNTVVGVFHTRGSAQQAVNELKRIGFTDSEIGVISRGDGDFDGDADTHSDTYAAEGGVAGLATGAGVGALWGLGIIAGVLPAIGPAIAGGTLAAILSSAAAGAAAAGIAGSLVGMGISKEEADFYEDEVEAGRTVVTVAAGSRFAEAETTLRRYGAYDMKTPEAERVSAASMHTESMRSTSDKTNTMQAASTAASGEACSTMGKGTTGNRTIQAKEEELHVRKHPVETGEVTVSKEVHTEHKTIEVPVEREEIVIERHPVTGGRAAEPIGAGETIRVPVREEHVHVEKTPVVKEEVTIGKQKVQSTEQVGATVRKEEIKVSKTGDASIRDKR